jgi:hypothetical protein
VNEFTETVNELRHQWRMTRDDTGISFQEFLLINLIIHLEAVYSFNG